jgi:ATP-binding cassette subfamily B protein
VFKLFKQARLSKLKVFLLMLFIGIQITGTLYLPTLTADIINKGVVVGDTDFVRETGVIMLGVALLTGVFSILATYFSAEVATTFARNTRKKLFGHTQKLSYQDYKQVNTSSLITRATNDIEQLQTTLSMFFDMMLPAPFVVAIGLVLAFTRDFYMALIIIISSVLMVTIMALVAKAVFPLFGKVQKGLDGINGVVAQYIAGIRVVRAFNRTKLEQERMDEAFTNYLRQDFCFAYSTGKRRFHIPLHIACGVFRIPHRFLENTSQKYPKNCKPFYKPCHRQHRAFLVLCLV